MATENQGFIHDAWSLPCAVNLVPAVQNPPPSYTGPQPMSFRQVPVIEQPPIVEPQQSYVAHIILAAFVVVVAFPFGVAALILAVMASSSRKSSSFATASLILSLSGIVIVGIVGLALGLTLPYRGTWNGSGSYTSNNGNSNGNSYSSSGNNNNNNDNIWTPLLTTTTSTTTTTTTTRCPNYLYSFCYPYSVRWSQASSCRFGVFDQSTSGCFYDARVYVGASDKCGGDQIAGETYCYYTTAARCGYARNYHNGICYDDYLVVADSTHCRHGYYNSNGLCYYDTSYLSADDTCDGGKADRGTDGYCHYSSATACPYAGNYIDGQCFTYVLKSSSGSSLCPAGTYRNGYCYYKNAKNIGSGFGSLFQCNPFTKDHIGNYCYYN